ncbi:hypothetical protein [Mesoterricola sediminis]|uniref:Uncharacterized protein n=1 Tax=Mesoterricola sediminis TaxID=2927980 RepID=A0AA48GU42_9BACT|nr:hypothetical protein [Mesoterricola sediminis]BDU76244.1 hypothetical protein METESE_12020 [Mesoterricola sediminis]
MSDPIINAIKEMKERLSRIDAAREGEPPMPDRIIGPDGSRWAHLPDVEAWGRQGWDAAAALRVELAEVTEAAQTYIEQIHELEARHEAHEGVVEEVPKDVPAEGDDVNYDILRNYATRLRARLIGTMDRENRLNKALLLGQKNLQAETLRTSNLARLLVDVRQFVSHKDACAVNTDGSSACNCGLSAWLDEDRRVRCSPLNDDWKNALDKAREEGRADAVRVIRMLEPFVGHVQPCEYEADDPEHTSCTCGAFLAMEAAAPFMPKEN